MGLFLRRLNLSTRIF